MKSRLTWMLGIGCLALTVLAPTSRGGSVTFGDLVLGETNAFPFAGIYYDAFEATRYQQVYAGTQFGAGLFAISSVTFFNGSIPSNLANGTYLISLSTTTAAIGALNTNMADNVGANSQVIFDGSLVPTLAANAPMTFTWSTPFDYNPAEGNLLLDIQISGVTLATSALFAAEDGGFVTSSRMVNGLATDTNGYGLVTQFVFNGSAVPEPGTLGMATIGVVGVALFDRRRRRSRGRRHCST
jgi:PEP-CTERM motif